ncbi:MAG: hypothetical protein O3C49_08755 [Proteobacteria bacterium]|nr:hypothetical protein [Pseudomonadota bacterium]MDA1325634.1 hypothetical protein [Pseudomonadota bacterium]
MKKFRCLFLVAFAAASLAGCETTLPLNVFPELRYSHLPPIRLDAVRVEVVEQYKSVGARPYVEHEFPHRPAAVAARWATDRLQAVGTRNMVRVTILQGSVVEVPLARTDGLMGLFTIDQSEKYDGALSVQVEIIGPGGQQLAYVTSQTTQSRSVSEDITLADREKTWFRMTEAMMNDLNLSLERQIQQQFKPWLR